MGHKIQQHAIIENEVLDISRLIAGSYVLLVDMNGKINVFRFVKY